MFDHIPKLLSSMLLIATCICIMASIYSSFLKDNADSSQMLENFTFGCNLSLSSSACIVCVIVLLTFVKEGHYDELKSDVKSGLKKFRNSDDDD